MINKANINWKTKQVVKMIEKGTLLFDATVQHGYVWDIKRKSLLIHSLIAGYPVPPFYCVKAVRFRLEAVASDYEEFFNGK